MTAELAERTHAPRKFGICMEGCEAGFEEVVRASIANLIECEFFRYVEIGVAGGHTLKAVTEICRAVLTAGEPGSWKKWVTIGVDLPASAGAGMGYGYALSVEMARGAMPDLVVCNREIPALEYGRPHLVLARSGDLFREWPFRWSLDLVLIDGCHGKACVRADFEAIERYMVPGGYVVFHDAGEREQGAHFQPHCREGINVRAALRELGLLPVLAGQATAGRAEEYRDGWRFVREIAGDAARGGHSCVVVQREPLAADR